MVALWESVIAIAQLLAQTSQHARAGLTNIGRCQLQPVGDDIGCLPFHNTKPKCLPGLGLKLGLYLSQGNLQNLVHDFRTGGLVLQFRQLLQANLDTAASLALILGLLSSPVSNLVASDDPQPGAKAAIRISRDARLGRELFQPAGNGHEDLLGNIGRVFGA